jgi:uncharacterized membrane protein HdeD (DUF308 family)
MSWSSRTPASAFNAGRAAVMVPLVAGAVWVAAAWSTLAFAPNASPLVAQVAGAVLVMSAVVDLLRASIEIRGRWWHAGLAALAVALGLLATLGLESPAAGPAALVGLLLMVRGVCEIAMAVADRAREPMWGLALAIGAAQAALGVWASGPFARTPNTLIMVAGAFAMLRGVADLATGLQSMQATPGPTADADHSVAAGLAAEQANLAAATATRRHGARHRAHGTAPFRPGRPAPDRAFDGTTGGTPDEARPAPDHAPGTAAPSATGPAAEPVIGSATGATVGMAVARAGGTPTEVTAEADQPATETDDARTTAAWPGAADAGRVSTTSPAGPAHGTGTGRPAGASPGQMDSGLWNRVMGVGGMPSFTDGDTAGHSSTVTARATVHATGSTMPATPPLTGGADGDRGAVTAADEEARVAEIGSADITGISAETLTAAGSVQSGTATPTDNGRRPTATSSRRAAATGRAVAPGLGAADPAAAEQSAPDLRARDGAPEIGLPMPPANADASAFASGHTDGGRTVAMPLEATPSLPESAVAETAVGEPGPAREPGPASEPAPARGASATRTRRSSESTSTRGRRRAK